MASALLAKPVLGLTRSAALPARRTSSLVVRAQRIEKAQVSSRRSGCRVGSSCCRASIGGFLGASWQGFRSSCEGHSSGRGRLPQPSALPAIKRQEAGGTYHERSGKCSWTEYQMHAAQLLQPQRG